MSITPKRNSSNFSGKLPKNSGFSPVSGINEVSPQKNQTGAPRIVRDLTADLYNSIQKWNEKHLRGCTIVKDIANLKQETNSLTPELEKYVDELYDIVESLKTYQNLFEGYLLKTKALGRLRNQSKPIFALLNEENIVELVEEVVVSYGKELQNKIMVLENIAYAKNESNAMFYAICWTYQIEITDTINLKLEALLIGTEHKKCI